MRARAPEPVPLLLTVPRILRLTLTCKPVRLRPSNLLTYMEHTVPTIAQLKVAQAREFPDYVQLTPVQILTWAERAPNEAQRRLRYRALAQCLAFDAVLFYRTNEVSGSLGARYGTESHEYLSGFDFL